ncbi:MAG: FAD:protein FMN transferase [Acholeplasma sp.]|nr:FAD:protein FMN transferase [Acholeplasma sp.]
MKKILINLFLFLSAFILISCDKERKDFEGSFTSMGDALIGLKVYNEDENIAKADELFLLIKERIEKINKLTDNFKSYDGFNNVKYINDNPLEKIEIEEELFNILELAEEQRISTNGYFDISIGLIIDEWKKLLDSNKEITEDDITKTEEIVDKILIVENGILLEKDDGKFYITIKSGVKIDLGALAKGYAINVANDILRDNGITKYMLTGSNSSAYYGVNPRRDNKMFIIGLVGPSEFLEQTGENYYGIILVNNTSITTSGDSIQRVKVGEKIIHHIISPKTKRPEIFRSMVTIYHEDAGAADALTTALMAMPKDVFDKWYSDNSDTLMVVLESDMSVNMYLPDDLIGK